MRDARQMRADTEAYRSARRPVIVAIGNAGGAPALRTARLLAARDGSPAVVASVVEPPPIYSFEARRALLVPWTIDQQLLTRRESVLARLRELDWRGEALGEPEVEVVYGEAASELADLAREREARLVVMGLGPHAPMRRLLAGGTVWATCRHSPCPVLAVAERATVPPKVVVLATDFSPESIHAAREALCVMADAAVVHVVHAWTRSESETWNTELADLDTQYEASLPERFNRFREALGQGHEHTFTTHAVEGHAAEAVLAIAHAQHADLVVGGTHGAGMLERWLLGSTSTALLRGAECSVLLAPPPPVAERTQLLRHMTGTSTVRSPADWNAELQAFVQRNQDRRTTLEIDDRAIGAQVQESGWSLVGATYDPHDHHIALMFGGTTRGRAHLTRSLGNVRSVAVASGPLDEDRALCIESDRGSALITFIDHADHHGSSANT